ncbi:unnamed protein product [Chrysoparadoxa australica]
MRCLLAEIELASGQHNWERATALLEHTKQHKVDGKVHCRCRGSEEGDKANAVPGSRGNKENGGKKKGKKTSRDASSSDGCLGFCCWDSLLQQTELCMVEGDLCRHQGDLGPAAEAYDRGLALLAPLAQDPQQCANTVDACSGGQDVLGAIDGNTHGGDEPKAPKQADASGLGGKMTEQLAGLRWRRGRCHHIEGNRDLAQEYYTSSKDTQGAPPLEQALALYRLAQLVIEDDSESACGYLKVALGLVKGSGAPKLVRRVKRALVQASLYAAGGIGISSCWEMAALSSLSAGVMHCNQLLAKQPKSSHTGKLFKELNEDAASLKEAVRGHLPEDWTIVSLCITPQHQLLMTRLCSKAEPLTLSLPLGDAVALLDAWDALLQENRHTLRGHSASEVASWKQKEKVRWWESRQDVDARLGQLLQELQSQWFDEFGVSALLKGLPVSAEICSQAERVLGQALGKGDKSEASKCKERMLRACMLGADGMDEAAWQNTLTSADLCDSADIPGMAARVSSAASELFCSGAQPGKQHQSPKSGKDCSVAPADVPKMKVAELKELLADHGVDIAKGERKAQLVAKLLAVVQEVTSSTSQGQEPCKEEDTDANTAGANEVEALPRHPVILVLDEKLQGIPWEGLPCLKGRPVTRVPAVPFIFSSLEADWPLRKSKLKAPTSYRPAAQGIRVSKGYYILDPERNLPSTRATLGPVLADMEATLGWKGRVGVAPPASELLQALSEEDLFIYCGHGAGELLLGRDAVAALPRCSVAILMGCSSGRLKGYGEFEPSGMVSAYLVAGSPAVVANLWDVTDRDIDRYSVALMEALAKGTAGPGATLAHHVAQSRRECKLRNIIGCAPVCYGIPIGKADA